MKKIKYWIIGIITLLLISLVSAHSVSMNLENLVQNLGKEFYLDYEAKIIREQYFEKVNNLLESWQPEDFLTNFLAQYHQHSNQILQLLEQEMLSSNLNETSIKEDPGNYLLLLGKMYLYDVLPKNAFQGDIWDMYSTQSRFLLAFFYLKVSAEKYQNAQAYYYLALLEHYKLTPHETLLHNLQIQIDKVSKNEGFETVEQLHYQELAEYLKNIRFYNVQHYLFMSSMLGHNGASLALATLYKEGIGVQKNCTTALAYYLSIIKKTYVDFYEFRTSYIDGENFEKELYSKQKVKFQNNQNIDIVTSSDFLDSQTIKATYELAQNYFLGKTGFRKNYKKAAQLYAKLAAYDHKNSMAMLGMCYFKGQGVPMDRKRAKVLFQNSNKVSLSEAMLIIMDYFEIQSKGNRNYAIKRMKEIYQKKKQIMSPVLKYLFGSLIIKGDISGMKPDDGVLLLGHASAEGHMMAKIALGLLFADGIDVNYDCKRAIENFAEEGTSHPFFMEKFHIAKVALQNKRKTFPLIKYLQLATIGDTNSFINALYILQIYKEQSLGLNQNSWSLAKASQNKLYTQLKKLKIVPDMHSYILQQYSFAGKKIFNYQQIEKFLEGTSQSIENYYTYIKKKIIKVCAITKQNSLMNFYEYKMSKKPDPTLLSTIANGEATKLHVLESRYLLGQHYHKRSFQNLNNSKHRQKQIYKAEKQYQRATGSQVLGKAIFYFEQFHLNPNPLNLEDQLYKFDFIDDLLTYTFVLSIVLFVLYYKRSKKLDEIHKRELEKREEENRQMNNQISFQNRSNYNYSNSQSQQQQKKDKRINQQSLPLNQPQNTEDTQNRLPKQKYVRIGSFLEQQTLQKAILEPYQKYQIQKEEEQKPDQIEQNHQVKKEK